jgi:outer membrane protein TolC
MRKTFLLFIVLISTWVPFGIFAAEQTRECKAVNYQELVRCAEKQSTEIQISEQQLKTAEKLEDIAGQWVNPELDADSVSKGSEKSETNATLFFTLRLGGKRNALLGEAQGEVEKAKAGRDLGVYQSRLELMLSLYRLSHLKIEIHIENESVDTFSKIVQQFQKRPALSPEQDVSLSVFKMSLADHQLRLIKLQSEEERLFLALKAVTGLSKEVIARNLPSSKQQWPSIEGNSSQGESPQVRMAIADLKLARSQKERAEGESWPDIKIGPSMKALKENGESNTLVGVALSMPLPIFTQNGGGRAYSAQRLAEAEMGAELAKRKSLASRTELVNRYSQIVQALKSSLSLTIANKSHEQLEKQFFRGLVPSSLVIEAHRQLFELGERRNASELEALEALGRVLIIDNQFSEVIL